MSVKLVAAILLFSQLSVADEHVPRETTSSSESNVNEKILRTNTALKSYREIYVKLPHNKAFAQSPEGHWNWRADRVTTEIAVEDALASCNKHVRINERPCVIINLNDEWVNPAQ